MKIEYFTDTKGRKCIEVFRDNYEHRKRFNGYRLKFSENQCYFAGKRDVYINKMNEADYIADSN